MNLSPILFFFRFFVIYSFLTQKSFVSWSRVLRGVSVSCPTIFHLLKNWSLPPVIDLFIVLILFNSFHSSQRACSFLFVNNSLFNNTILDTSYRILSDLLSTSINISRVGVFSNSSLRARVILFANIWRGGDGFEELSIVEFFSR